MHIHAGTACSKTKGDDFVEAKRKRQCGWYVLMFCGFVKDTKMRDVLAGLDLVFSLDQAAAVVAM
jgi:hypothetical protein